MKRILFFCAAMLAVLTCNAQSSVQVLKDGKVIAEFYEQDGWEFRFRQGGDQPVVEEHEAVDLGLPSGLKWASCNVGAEGPYQAGDYFAFGETDTYYNGTYPSQSWKTGKEAGYVASSYFDCSLLTTGAYEFFKYSFPNGKTVLDECDDVAHVKWGGNWRMPTTDDFYELIDECDWTWENGGYLVTSKHNGNSIFLPAAGAIQGTSNIGTEYSIYRANSLYNNLDNAAVHDINAYSHGLAFTSQFIGVTAGRGSEDNQYTGILRFNGCSVRPVCQ